MMRVLTVRQPWAWAIIHGGKDVENRVRNLAGTYRGPVAIHAALRHDDEYDRHLVGAAIGKWRRANPGVPSADNPDTMKARSVWFGHLGHIIGVVDLVDVHHCFNSQTNFEGCSPWAQLDAWHLALANPQPVAEPIPFKGALGLRTLPADVEAQIVSSL